MTEQELILQNFEKNFGSFRGRRIVLYDGEYCRLIQERFGAAYRF